MSFTRMLACTALLAILAGCNFPGGNAAPSATLPPTETPAPTAAATATSAPSPTPQPSATPAPPTAAPAATTVAPTAAGPQPTNPTTFVYDQYVRSGSAPAALSLSGSVTAGAYDRYRLSLATGEGLDVRLSSPQQTAGFVLLGPDGRPLPGTENHRALWYSANAGSSGEYAVIVTSQLGRADYLLEIKVNALAVTPTGGAYAALPESECREVRGRLRAALGVPLAISQGGFTLNTGSAGSACQLAGEGTGENFTNPPAVMELIDSALGDWDPAAGFTYDSAAGSLRGYSRGGDLLVASVQWYPAPGASCPAGVALADCGLPPDQVLFSLLIQAARK